MRGLGIGRAAAIVVAVASLPAVSHVLRPWRPQVAPARAAQATLAVPERTAWDSLDAKVVARDPFRPSRRPAAVPFDPNPVPPAPDDPPPPKPTLALTGIMWGAEPSAVIEGIPGFESAQLVRVGETVAGFRIRRITSTEVRITGMDTTWVLQVRKPW